MSMLQDLLHWSVYGIPAFLFLITVVVFVHELGHFSVARYFGTKVETFSIGFGPAIVKWTDSKGTLWKISWIPLGGYVKFFGDADGASTPDREATARMTAADRKIAFPYKPLYQRALIVAAGPIANFILAIAILSGVFMFHGKTVIPPVVGKVEAHSAGEAAGLRTGDRIVSIDGTVTESYAEIDQVVGLSAGQRLPIVLDRGPSRMTIWATPRQIDTTDAFKNRIQVGDLGISPPLPPVIEAVLDGGAASRAGLRVGDVIVSIDGTAIEGYDQVSPIVSVSAGKALTIVVRRDGVLRTVRATPMLNDQKHGVLGIQFQFGSLKRLGPVAALGESVDTIGSMLSTTWRALVHSPSGAKQLSGVIGIAKLSGQVAEVSLLALIQLIALLSVSIGLVNLFPIPLLDGGHLLYYACEGVLRRPLSERAQDVGFRLGLAVVLGIFLLATWNDLVRLNLF
ncbi:MAG: RIP metalloprotease RseP [Alphaproteobacteria bacterium]|nr:RIP metalloprotease RseP [Alphaproteobacteria bacterium]MBL6939188.1 RIP metalloprotease RseP [Alphaproteobacteria bacterium]MBL7096704.1 RIP metalloprotease RseP [Alphaproteobacteria bacterium]